MNRSTSHAPILAAVVAGFLGLTVLYVLLALGLGLKRHRTGRRIEIDGDAAIEVPTISAPALGPEPRRPLTRPEFIALVNRHRDGFRPTAQSA